MWSFYCTLFTHVLVYAMHKRNTRKKHNTTTNKPTKSRNVTSSLKNYLGINEQFRLQDLILSPSFSWIACIILLPIELAVNILVIQRVKYTEIDWVAYMSEVEGFLNGTFDYSMLNGSTGPLVYPAGFVYIFSALYSITNHGHNIVLAQYIYAGVYLMSLAVIFRIYLKASNLPPYMFVILSCTAYRIHSIYILRLFNDPIAMLFLYTAVYAFLSNKWLLGCVLYSIGVSVKMNVLLFAPGLLVLFLQFHSLFRTIGYLSICAGVQVILGLPFLLTYPVNYMSRAFQLNRHFLFEWTVNWKFLPEEIFHNRIFHVTLITFLLIFLSSLFFLKWSKTPQINLQDGNFSKDVKSHILFVLFTSNFCGIVASRTLHFQFYVWYFHTLPFLIWKKRCPVALGLCLLGLIELSYKIFPSTPWSSAILQLSHVTIFTIQLL